MITEEEAIKDRIRLHILKLNEKLIHVDKILDQFLLDLDLDHTNKIKQIYEERTILKLKLKKTTLALENFKWKKKPKRELIECVLDSIIVTKEMVQFPSLWVGKNQGGNFSVYKKSPFRCTRWLHANVRGGGLVACDPEVDSTLAGAWALVYSKYLTTYGTTEGAVTISDNINATSTRGTFYFEEPKYIKSQVRSLSLYLKLIDSKLIISPVDLEGATAFMIRPTTTNRFEKVYQKYNLNSSRIRNAVLLESLLPYKWDLVPRT